MAVEARHLNLFPSQLLTNNNREIMNPMESNVNNNVYNLLPMGYGSFPTQGVDTAALLPMYSSGISDSLPPTTMMMKSESVVTNNAISRKRSRDQCPNGNFPYTTAAAPRDQRSWSPSFSFLGEDISLQIQQQDLDIDRLIAQHIEKVRFEIEEKRKNQARRILEAIEGRLVKRLRTKEEEIEKMVKMNYAMEERIKSLCVENQIWRDLAQSNEAAANALRMNLEQVLAHVGEDRVADLDNGIAAAAAAENPLADDAQSCCDSSGGGDCKTEEVTGGGGRTEDARDGRWCRECGNGEARVLLLPCRHLCLCTVCGTSVHTCPICKSAKTASVHVNVS